MKGLLEFAGYQEWQRSMDFYPQNSTTLAFHTLGLCGEAGEVAEKVKKNYRDQELSREDLLREFGDVLWYLSAVAGDLGYSLEDVARANILKLEDRRRRGVERGSGDHR